MGWPFKKVNLFSIDSLLGGGSNKKCQDTWSKYRSADIEYGSTSNVDSVEIGKSSFL